MLPEEVLRQPARILSRAQREFYFAHGYLAVEGLVERPLLDRLHAVTAEFVERSRKIRRSDAVFDLAPSHTAESPRVRRLKTPDAQHPLYWEYAQGIIADVVADLVGPDVVFHHSKLNFKWHDGGDEVKWHQDIQFYPHTNYSPLTVGTYLADTGMDDGPLMAIEGSHDGPLYDQYDGRGQWQGCLNAEDAASLDEAKVRHMTGPAGTITVHNCRTVHGSRASRRQDGRPLLLNAYSSADARPYTPHPTPTMHTLSVVRGTPTRWARHDPRPCLMPPDWSAGYTSIFASQAGENAKAAAPMLEQSPVGAT
ncbi:MAG: phytanoyl-CoA dioxygenase family protein [Alphaproteobacteria bacterium]|nr:phytanoyl-CoA dioxygenase family protein [Alphaproteobacteria bacterium]